MKIVIFGDQDRVGALLNERILDLNLADPGLPSNLRQFIEAGDRALDAAQRVADNPPDAAIVDANGVKLLSAISYHLSAISYQLSAISYQLSATN